MTNEVAQALQSHYWGAGSEWLWAFGQFVVISITAWLIFRQVKVAAMSHVVQAVCTIQERCHSERMQHVRLDVCSKWKNGKREFDGACEHIANFFEELGTFVKIGAIPKRSLWDVQSWNIEHYWNIFEKGIAHARVEYEEQVIANLSNYLMRCGKSVMQKASLLWTKRQ